MSDKLKFSCELQKKTNYSIGKKISKKIWAIKKLSGDFKRFGENLLKANNFYCSFHWPCQNKLVFFADWTEFVHF